MCEQFGGFQNVSKKQSKFAKYAAELSNDNHEKHQNGQSTGSCVERKLIHSPTKLMSALKRTEDYVQSKYHSRKSHESYLRILTWNANGLRQRAQELYVFLKINNIDIALITETHFTHKSKLKLKDYAAYWTTYPNERARGGTAVLIKEGIAHAQEHAIRETDIQATFISLGCEATKLIVGAVYCPPKHRLTRDRYICLFSSLGPRFVIGGDFNVKHTAWGSRTITPFKGGELLNAIQMEKCGYHSTGEPTHWPTDGSKVPDLLDFLISKGIAAKHIDVAGLDRLSSDHSPVLLLLSKSVIEEQSKTSRLNQVNERTHFGRAMVEKTNLNVKLQPNEDLKLHIAIKNLKQKLIISMKSE